MKPTVDTSWNLAALDAGQPPATNVQVLRHYGASLLIYGSLLLLVTLNPWYKNLVQVSYRGFKALYVYYYAFAAYAVLAPILFFWRRPRTLWHSKNLILLGCLARLIRGVWGRVPRGGPVPWWTLTYAERHAIAFLLIKLFYGPLMLGGMFVELKKFPYLAFFLRQRTALPEVLDLVYLMFVAGVFFVDCLIFFISYHTEAGILRNRLRYAETNLWRVLVCLLCYPPFLMVTVNYLGPSNQAPGILFQNDLSHPATWVLRGCAVLFLLILISSSLFLLTKASNLTNRGIVTTGPYRIVRHPGYTAKNLFWIATQIPLFFPRAADPGFDGGQHLLLCLSTAVGIVGWATLYFLRSIAEEQLLLRDPDYVAYCRKVKYRFIPGVY